MKEISENHPLRKLFRSATGNAFRFNQALRTDAIEEYFSEWLLARFVRWDDPWRAGNARGWRLAEPCGTPAPGGDRMGELALHQHIGDYVLFMAGIFPEGLVRGCPGRGEGLLVRLGGLYQPCKSPLDFYIRQGQASYRKASEFMREVSPDKAGVLGRLSQDFGAYVRVMSLVRLNLAAASLFGDLKGIVGSA
jgi:hypothetical protein